MTITNRNPTQILINKFQYPFSHFTSLELQKIGSIQKSVDNKLINKWHSMQSFWTSV